jgi:translation elongation factor EF-1beta
VFFTEREKEDIAFGIYELPLNLILLPIDAGDVFGFYN